jgi:large subunit ribosomal protein L32
MAVPKRRTSRSRKGNRRSQHHLRVVWHSSFCPRCNEPVLPHRVCGECGYYQGRDALPVPAEATRSKSGQ